MIKGRLKTERILIIWAVLTALLAYSSYYTGIHHVSTFSYTALALFWAHSLKGEITDTYIRRNMSLGGVLLTLLFMLRFIKYTLVPKFTFPHRLIWYGYYIPILITPLLSLMISLDIGGKQTPGKRRLLTVLKTICALLLIIVLTNDVHHLAIKIWYEGDEEYSTMGAVYFLIIIWYIGLMLASFIITIRKCILSSYRKHWVIPVAIELLGLFLLGWYYLICNSSSPKLNGYNLYNVQEVYVLLFIGFWESMIATGLIPTVSLARDRYWISDGIFGTVSGEISKIRSILGRIQNADDDTFRDGIIRISFIGIYIKRRANLELIPTKTGFLSSSELSLAIRETLDFFDFSRISAGFEESGDSVMVPSSLIGGIFDLLKNVIYKAESACYIKLVTGKTPQEESITLTIEADMDLTGVLIGTHSPGSLADGELFDALGAKFRVYEEDDTWNIQLTASYPHSHEGAAFFPKKYGKAEYGLSQITSYLSLENEALDAKTRIHDNLGRCLLMTKAYLTGQYPITRDAIISEWNRIITQMSQPLSDAAKSDSIDTDYFIRQAKSMGVDVAISGEIPGDERLRKIIDTALTVHITNVLRHAKGNKAYIDIERTADSYIFTFTNDGVTPDTEIIEKGGLKNLRRHVEEIGGTMEIEWADGFKMILTFPI